MKNCSRLGVQHFMCYLSCVLEILEIGAGSTYELMILSEAGVSGEFHNKVFAPSICNHFGEGPAAQISGRIKE